MAELFVDSDLDEELDALSSLDEDAVGLLDAFIQELAGDQRALQTLTRTPKWEWNYNPPFEIKRFQACWDLNPRRQIYSIKLFDDEGHRSDYRLLIGHDPRTDTFVALSFLDRGIAYDVTRPEFQILLARYDGWNLPVG